MTAKQTGMNIQHAFYGGGEARIEGLKVDGLAEDGTILEFHRCLYHGCLDCYKQRSTKNTINGLTMDELREKTRIKTEMLCSKGHVVVEKWECIFRKEVKENEELKMFFKTYEPYMPINPRDAFFWGRTNVVRLHCQHPNIRYVDFMSLYPFVCKYGLFPLVALGILCPILL